MEIPNLSPAVIEWGVATRVRSGETESGDRYLVKPFQDKGSVLAVVVDGLGHGKEAAAAAIAAIAVMDALEHDSLISIVSDTHAKLQGTRGVVMSLAMFQKTDHTMIWMGVGNVTGVLLRFDPDAVPHKEHMLLRGGVVGHQLPHSAGRPQLLASILTVARGDTLIFATDGVSPDFIEGIFVQDTPQRIADSIMARYYRPVDDALVLVARYTG
jgi:hypothetical protein